MMNATKLTVLINLNDQLILSTRFGNKEALLGDLSVAYNHDYGNWLITPTENLPADFSVNTYTIIDGALVKASEEIIAQREALRLAAEASVEIKALQDYLTSTDYAAIKCGELGLAIADEYPELYAGRTAARTRINELQEGGAE